MKDVEETKARKYPDWVVVETVRAITGFDENPTGMFIMVVEKRAEDR